MAKRPKTRIHHLADALEQLQKTQEALAAIDLRTCRGELRQRVKASRDATAQAIAETTAAMKADVPEAPKVAVSS